MKPVVNEMEHQNEYPEKFIEQMKDIGICGLAVPEEFGGAPVSTPCYVQVTEELSRDFRDAPWWSSVRAPTKSRRTSLQRS